MKAEAAFQPGVAEVFVGGLFDCLACTLEMPNKDDANHPDPVTVRPKGSGARPEESNEREGDEWGRLCFHPSHDACCVLGAGLEPRALLRSRALDAGGSPGGAAQAEAT